MFVLVALLVLGAFAFIRLRFGYPPPDARLEVIGAGDANFLKAAATTFFPGDEGETHALGKLRAGASIDFSSYMDAYLQQLPRRQRLLIRALLILFEQSTIIWPARGLGAFRRFSFMTPEQQHAVMRGWQESRLYLRRTAFAALKAVMVLGYLGDQENLRALGLAPWDIESPIVEADLLYPPIGLRPEHIEFTIDDLPPIGGKPTPAPPLRGGQGTS